MNFSDILKQIMDEHGITQQQLADKSGVHRVTISKYWNGKPARDDSKLKLSLGLSELTGFSAGVFYAMFQIDLEED
jgi:transcriptional regulator with XRE-family HTH domain